MITFATALLPVRNPNRFPALEIEGFKPKEFKNYESLLDEYLNQLEEVIPLIETDMKVISLTTIVPSEEQIGYFNANWKSISHYFYDYVEVKISYKNDIERKRKDNPQIKDCTDEELVSGSAAVMLAITLERAQLCSEISFPGLLNISKGVALEDESPVIGIRSKPVFNCIRDEVYWPNEEWPKLNIINVSEVFSWLNKIGYGESFYARTSIQRTLASFAYVIRLGQYNEGESLFRVMQGLEAFYTSGTGDLRRQLSEKSKVFLNGKKLKTNMVGRLYDFRSKFIHGASTIRYPDAWDDDSFEKELANDKKIVEFDQSLKFGLILLISSIQKCVKENIVDVDWGYTYETIHE